MNQSVLQRLSAALVRLRIAEGECPHWDYESDGDAGRTCCRELTAAQQSVKAARARVERVRSGRSP